MDPLSIAVSASTLITICISTVLLIKKSLESLSHAGEELVKFLTRTERIRLLLEQLRGLTRQTSASQNTLLLAYSDTECRNAILAVRSLVEKIGRSKFSSIHFVINQNEAKALLDELDRHQADIETVLLSVAT